MTEIWKDINGFEGIYRISNQGNVLSVRNNIILKPYKKGNGYLGVKLQLRGKHIDKKIHRLVAQHTKMICVIVWYRLKKWLRSDEE